MYKQTQIKTIKKHVPSHKLGDNRIVFENYTASFGNLMFAK
jgi:hypothetical protein